MKLEKQLGSMSFLAMALLIYILTKKDDGFFSIHDFCSYIDKSYFTRKKLEMNG